MCVYVYVYEFVCMCSACTCVFTSTCIVHPGINVQNCNFRSVHRTRTEKAPLHCARRTLLNDVFVILFEQKSRKLRPVRTISDFTRTITSYVTSRNFFTAGVAYIFCQPRARCGFALVAIARSSMKSKALG